jgi:hypothetical protein
MEKDPGGTLCEPVEQYVRGPGGCFGDLDFGIVHGKEKGGGNL